MGIVCSTAGGGKRESQGFGFSTCAAAEAGATPQSWPTAATNSSSAICRHTTAVPAPRGRSKRPRAFAHSGHWPRRHHEESRARGTSSSPGGEA